jgi:hypothetical protein
MSDSRKSDRVKPAPTRKRPKFAQSSPRPRERALVYHAPEPSPGAGFRGSEGEPDDRQPLLLELAEGDITRTTSRLILLAQFQGLEPSEAWVSLDFAMGGALRRLSKRRPPALVLGELDVVPTGRHRIMAEEIVFLGLGSITDFGIDGSSLSNATESGLRGLLICHVEEFATVLLGANMADSQAGFDVEFSLRHMMNGFTRALRDELPEGRLFRRITLVEKDAVRMNQMHEALEKLISEGTIFEGFAVNLLRHHLPASEIPESSRTLENLLILSTKVDAAPASPPTLAVRLYPAQQHASIPYGEFKPFDSSVLNLIYDHAGFVANGPSHGVSTDAAFTELSNAVSQLLPKDLLRHLTLRKNSTVRIDIVDDRETAAVPWECLNLGPGRYPALSVGISRRFAGNRERVVTSPASDGTLKVLLVIDPTGDLPGAREEGRKLSGLLEAAGISRKIIIGEEATRTSLAAILNAEDFQILHFAGHSGYHRDKADRFRSSGLLMHGEEYFTGSDALALKRLPPIVVFNSCEAARIARLDPVDGSGKTSMNEDGAVGAVTIAEAFLKVGIQHFVGTFWPVRDTAATLFSETFYKKLAAKESVGEAMLSSRKVLYYAGALDWANYIHYGDPTEVPFILEPK